jgi:hypothetical protein
MAGWADAARELVLLLNRRTRWAEAEILAAPLRRVVQYLQLYREAKRK